MSRIKFSHIFDEDIERVYECFASRSVSSGIAFKDFLTNIKFLKGERFDDENAEFQLRWKNYYDISLIVENVKNEEFYKCFSIRSTKIDKLPTEMKMIYNFYWDSVDQKTLFVLELEYQEKFFGDLFSTEFSPADKLKLCKNIEQYLNSINKGLETSDSCVLNAHFEEVWKILGNPNKLSQIISKDIIIACNEEEISVSSVIELQAKQDQNNTPIPLIKFIVNSITLTSDFAKLSLVTLQRFSFPSQRLTILLKQLENNKCFFTIIVKPFESINYETRYNLKKFWRKKMMEIYNFFEIKNQKLNKNSVKQNNGN